MKNLFRFLMGLSLCFLSAGLDAQTLDTIRRKDPANWEYIQVLKKDKLHSEGYLHNGVVEGVWTTYWDSGYPMYVTAYNNGKKNGVNMQVDAQGFTTLVEHFKDDLLEGPRRVYIKTTQGISEEAYYSEGKKHGRYFKKYASGKTQEEGSYKYDKRDGTTTWYYENGQKAAEYSYKDDVIDGEVSIFDVSGKVTEFGRYRNNLQTGPWKEFYTSGNIKAEGNYENGEKEGPWKEYNDEGKLAKTVKYHKGQIK